jgi:hypothetical protein
MPDKESALQKYILHKPGDLVALNLGNLNGNSVVAQMVSGEGVAQVEVSVDYGYSWYPIALYDMGTMLPIKAIRRGPPAWAMTPGVTNARVVLIENDQTLPCKVNLRYGRT